MEKEFAPRIQRAFARNDGPGLAEALSLTMGDWDGIDGRTAGKMKRAISRANLPSEVHAELVCSVVDAAVARSAGDPVASYEELVKAHSALHKILRSEKGWIVPVVEMMCAQLRRGAMAADEAVVAGGGMEQYLGQCTEPLRKIFAALINAREAFKGSRKEGALFVVNQLFFAYFKLNLLLNCKGVIRSVETRLAKVMTKFRISQQVTYKYFTGRLALFDGKYEEASNLLGEAFDLCDRTPAGTSLAFWSSSSRSGCFSARRPSRRSLPLTALTSLSTLPTALSRATSPSSTPPSPPTSATTLPKACTSCSSSSASSPIATSSAKSTPSSPQTRFPSRALPPPSPLPASQPTTQRPSACSPTLSTRDT
ncbi:uncharacterized protein AMSG_00471 [Thecamonas trahens ATCC 50062]|uniref:PCI domain-containing protein n=1 Tax=Thecamonas trahens ATCC 50062 TaxID=461836 RepID=A0A0L0D8L9_THETB|nr:hypothetical protein AMSG_00471 [Thecamonas trahens ATCC 50062]KNC48694.1 hypothetical protein AMSG_00471 [Thecamonas trahens ATCC 50062]|eukprot:XP_013762750.1 hypothetical protein AMSG_00471 [Thecamonas trahens ATCC 50062]